ncbi:class C sortase [Amphibacillus indicireducens]|uniref:Class C sortase n=1 Tax=Amphibacillus indicireducens TaxID=1076330 RepID=A0ABP7W0L0_9BACI
MGYKKILMLIIFLIGLSLVLYPMVSKKYYQAHLNEVVASFNEGYEKAFLEKDSEIDDSIFATIEIPKINLHLPIYYGASNEILSNGIGLIENMHESIGGPSTHSILAGHSGIASKELFTNVHKLEIGDIFKINMRDDQLEYSVIDNQKIKVTETEYLEAQKDRDLVTLLTCPTFDSKNYRIIVIGERINDD